MSSRRPALVTLALVVSTAACGLSIRGLAVDGDAAPTTDGGNTDPTENDAGFDPDAGLDPDAAASDGSDATATAPCPELIVAGGAIYNGHCYFPLTAPRTRATAVADCAAAQGAHLVTITTAAEQLFVAKVGLGDRWIGLAAPTPTNDRTKYVWVTGEPAGPGFWYVNDPDNQGPCVAMHGTIEQWVDRVCTDSYPAICERE